MLVKKMGFGPMVTGKWINLLLCLLATSSVCHSRSIATAAVGLGVKWFGLTELC